MSTTRKAAPKTPRKPRRDSHPATRSATPSGRLRSRPCSALIKPDGTPRNHATSSRKPASGDPLDGAPIVVSVEYTTPGSPLDEHLRREQTRALLNLLADHARRQRSRGSQG
jgi:hypothetical protein